MLDATGQISGRDRAIKLVRSLMERPESAGEPSSQHYPVLVFEGARGSGKTALLDTLATALTQQVPYARFNFKAKPDATVPEVLSALASKLGRRCPLYGVLDFPRLTAGRLDDQFQGFGAARRVSVSSGGCPRSACLPR